MRENRIVFRSTLKSPSLLDRESQTTDISFVPVCDNCNYVLDRVSGKVGISHLYPFMCPNCSKIFGCARLPVVDANGELNYEED
jgi:hypothetical protein